VTCNGGGADSDRGPPFQLTLHVTAGRRSTGTARRRSVLEASDLSVEQARFLVLFPQNRGRYLLAGENRRDLRRFPAGGWYHNSKSRRFFRPHFASRPPLRWLLSWRGGGPPMRGVASLMRHKGSTTAVRPLFRRGCVTCNGEFKPPLDAPPLRVTRGRSTPPMGEHPRHDPN
jgi:hypothetical protein